jgi:hypothetical protein
MSTERIATTKEEVTAEVESRGVGLPMREI